MCTAIHLSDDGLFGRTLDYESSFGEGVVFTPREFMRIGEARNRYAILGVGVVRENVTLYFDGMNEWGLCGAALNFEGRAEYHDVEDKKAGIPSAALLSFILGFCRDVGEIKGLFRNVGITADTLFGMPPSPLHWMFADRTGAIVIESTDRGVRVMDNPYGVLTNSPDFDYQVTRLADYMSLSVGYPENELTKAHLNCYSRGMGAIGLPGDFSSTSRFVRAAFVKENTKKLDGDGGKIEKMMHVLSSVSVPYGCVITRDGESVSTRYTSIMDGEELTYYFKSYGNCALRAVKLYPEHTDMRVYPIYEKENIIKLN